MNQKTLAMISAAVVCLAAALLLTLGCRNQRRPAGMGPAAGGVTPKQDHLTLALDYLSRLDEVDPQEGMIRTAYHLNRWIEDHEDEVPWQQSPMLNGLPRELRGIGPLAELPKREFTTEDVMFLREVSWMQSISERVSQQTTELGLDDWLDQVEQSRGEPHAYELAVAARLFDWTVRNIQLDELLPYPTASAGSAEEGDSNTPRATSPLMEAKPRPGYTAFTWQTLLFGRGDAWQRARVFIQLARQQQIDVVMLALDDARQLPHPRPWLPAVLIDDQLYLFDAELGMPIPGPGGIGVATLEQVREDKDLLSNLDAGSSYPYAPAKADLDEVVALIDASPGFLSQRMKLVDAQTATGQQLVLAVDPSGLAERVRQCEGISDVQLWHVPYETWVFRKARGPREQEDPELIRRLMLDEWIFAGLTPMVQGRQLQFRGRFENNGQKKGAKAYYLESRVPDAEIEQIETSPEVQYRMGISRGRLNDQQWQAKLLAQKSMVTRIKRNVSYWMALIHYETGNYEAAMNWLKTRTLEAAADGPWTGGARYNLSRVYEQMGDLEQARDVLLLDDSPQKHGNLLRARFLRKKLEAQGANTADVD